MTDIAIDRLRIRGPSGARLARVAATLLPAALDRALGGTGDVGLARIHVRLELDVNQYDDETLAVLWADAIRAEVLRTAPRARRRTPDDGVVAAASLGAPRVSPGAILAALSGWLGGDPGRSAAIPAAVLALADPDTADAVRALLAPAEWSTLLHRLDRLLLPPAADADVPDPTPVPPVPQQAAAADAPMDPPPLHAPGIARAHPPGQTPRPALAPEEYPAQPDVLARLRILAALAGAPGGPAPVLATAAAGLVLLYPWLADHCRRAEVLNPHLEAVAVREAALASVADPGRPALADDPLVGFLAGRPLPTADSAGAGPPTTGDHAARSLSATGAARERIPLRAAAQIAESGTAVVHSFAALLPGFERSSPAFLRDELVLRAGLLDPDRDPPLLTAATHPLDVLLPLLPFPVGLMKLPWSAPLATRFR